MTPTVAPRRRVLRVAACSLLLTLLTATVGVGLLGPATGRAYAAEPGPAMQTSEQARADAVSCAGDASRGAIPVLLVHGTGATPLQNFGTTYLPYLTARGHVVCTVALPEYGTGDVQDNVEYVATAIRLTQARAQGRKISVIGHSQGAYLPRIALRLYPDLVRLVDDVVGLAGVYDAGSVALRERCDAVTCTPALHQLTDDSALTGEMGKRRLPAGPSYTNIGSLRDTVITPQPAANRQPGATAIELQDVCPGHDVLDSDHGNIVGDPVARALVTDALDHAGPAVAARIDRGSCSSASTSAAPLPRTVTAMPYGAPEPASPVLREPAVRCYVLVRCADVRSRGRLLAPLTTTPARRTLVWRLVSTGPGVLRVRYDGRRVVRQVSAGTVVTLRLRTGERRRTAVLETKPAGYVRWATEQRLTVRPGR